jgi:hypothetical protein
MASGHGIDVVLQSERVPVTSQCRDVGEPLACRAFPQDRERLLVEVTRSDRTRVPDDTRGEDRDVARTRARVRRSR